MKAKMLNQTYHDKLDKTSKFEKKKNLDKDLWSTSYITDIVISTCTKDAVSQIKAFIARQFGDVLDIAFERNGMTGFWQFTIISDFEVMDFDIAEETPQEVTERLMPIAEQWFMQQGIDEYGSDWEIDDIIEKDSGNTIWINLKCDNGIDTAVLIKKENGEWQWQQD